MAISYNGYNRGVLTMESDGEITVGVPVDINNSGKCINAAADSEFIGVAINARDNLVGVQTDGYIECKYTGSAPSMGYCNLAADGSGGVKIDAQGDIRYKVIYVNKSQKTVGFIL